MKMIMTVTGPITPEQLGFTSMHEHVLTNNPFMQDEFEAIIGLPPANVFPPDRDESVCIEDLACLGHGYYIRSDDAWNIDDEELMGAEVLDFQTAGGSTILECSAPGIRQNVSGLQRISQKTGVHIVASTGLYAEESWPEKYKDMSVNDFITYMKYEIEYGMEDTDIKAGHIKTATNKITDRQLDFLKAAARTSHDTGLLVTAHLGIVTNEEDGRIVYNTLLESGIAPERLLMCHQQQYFYENKLETLITDPDSWKLKLDYTKEILNKGINICIDCIGITWDAEAAGMGTTNDYVSMAALVALIHAGYEDQIVIGTDVFMKLMTRRYGGHGYCRLMNYVVPVLKKIGISDKIIHKITVDNPAHMLSIRS